MAITVEVMKKWIITLNFAPVDGEVGIYQKIYPQHNGYAVRVDLSNKNIEYADSSVDQSARITIGSKSTSNFANQENLVVLECVNRLLEKGYSPNSIELEKIYPSGRGHSGELDVLVNDADGQAFLMIECKTWGAEHTKEYKKMLQDGGQLFTYYGFDTETKYLCLYSSTLLDGKIVPKNDIIAVSEEWKALSNTKERHNHWNKTFKDNGIFEEHARPYHIIYKALTYEMLQDLKEGDDGIIYNGLMEILRHNAISDKPNAFNKLLNLFICKIKDEVENSDNQNELSFQWREDDNDIELQMRLNDLYKDGMYDFVNIKVDDYTKDDFDRALEDSGASITSDNSLINKIYTTLRLKKSPNFAFKEIENDAFFKDNAKVVREIVELLQGYKFRYGQKHAFLGELFERILNDSMKQESGQFFTPVPIARFIISSLPLDKFVQEKLDNRHPQPLPFVIDFAVGAGHFLTEYMSTMQEVIEHARTDKANPTVKTDFKLWSGLTKFLWAKDYVYGIDLDYRLVKTAKVSAFFNGDGEARIICANGLGNFKKTNEYSGKLEHADEFNPKNNGQFDVLISNPPYSVDAFRRMLRHGAESFDLYSSLTDNSSEIECLFIERMKQLLKVGGWAGVILPSSILSNGGIYSRARDIIFKYFNVKAIVELGSGTFMETGTNTVILFLERRPDNDHERIAQAINTFFTNKRDVTVSGIERAFSAYVANVYDNLNYEDYVSFVNESPSDAMENHELYKDYVREFGDASYAKVFEVEKEKMLYFLLTYRQNVVVATSGSQKEDIRAFLGYKFIGRRGHEGLKHLSGGTMLFDENNVFDPQKINSYILNAFLGNHPVVIDETVAKHLSYGRMSGFLEYGTSKFGGRVNLSKKGKVALLTNRFELVKLGEIADIEKGQTMTAEQAQQGDVPVVAGGIEPSITHNNSNRNADVITVSASGANAGYVRYWEIPIFASDCNTVISKDKDRTLTKYLYICLKHLQSEIFSLQSGQAQPHVYEKDLREITVPLPP
ncbi:MAG: N-6 DNA methylase, partial [Oscillospiraceae bacterium]|nr:N-6 DNA methylase [Oscillospiraceae bacterium]